MIELCSSSEVLVLYTTLPLVLSVASESSVVYRSNVVVASVVV